MTTSSRAGTGLRPAALFLVLALPFWAGCGGSDAPQAGGPLVTHDLTELGLQHPAAVVVDTIADVYLVTNINGPEGVTDGNGFISRISPDGEPIAARWIDA